MPAVSERKWKKLNDDMTNKETFNVIQGLETIGLTDSQIVTFIKFVETSDPQMLDKLRNAINKPDNKEILHN